MKGVIRFHYLTKHNGKRQIKTIVRQVRSVTVHPKVSYSLFPTTPNTPEWIRQTGWQFWQGRATINGRLGDVYAYAPSDEQPKVWAVSVDDYYTPATSRAMAAALWTHTGKGGSQWLAHERSDCYASELIEKYDL